MVSTNTYKLKRLSNYIVLTKSIKSHSYVYRPRRDDITEKTRSNLSRAKRVVKDIMKLNLTPLSSFLTLTYADNMQCYETARLDYQRFIERLRRKGLNVSYLGVKEHQTRGAIHFHIVLFNDLRHVDFTKFWNKGFIYLKPIDDFDLTTSDKITNYMVKYLINAQKGQLVSKEKKLYFTSRDVLRTKEERLNVSEYLKHKEKASITLDLLTQEINFIKC